MSGYKHCSTESAADRQRQFEDALLELMSSKPLSQISIQDICGRLGLSRKSFYRYFSSKEACLEAMVDHAILDFTDLPVQRGQMYQMLERFFAYWLSRRRLLDVLNRNDCSDLLLERAMVCAVQEYGLGNYFQEKEGNKDRVVFFISGLFGVLLSWHLEGCKISPAQLAETLGEFFPQQGHHSVF